MTEQAMVQRSVVTEMAHRFGMERAAFEQTLKKTIMPTSVVVSNEQLASFLVVAKQYDLNPFIKEIYAFPARGGGIQPIVSVDGWMSLINRQPMYDGMEIEDKFDGSQIVSTTCKLHRKDRKYPLIITEYFNECVRNTDQWKQKPVRMLHHKAVIQAARYAFGFAGIIDPDEAERMIEMGAVEVVGHTKAAEATVTKIGELREQLRKQVAPEQPVEVHSDDAA